jgi:hypothetical protein
MADKYWPAPSDWERAPGRRIIVMRDIVAMVLPGDVKVFCYARRATSGSTVWADTPFGDVYYTSEADSCDGEFPDALATRCHIIELAEKYDGPGEPRRLR